ncbi:MAG: ABC transporter permease subunit [Thermoplasmata archaeon]|nr:ABC transporter permease subunit [Thermoplasmata archaeon]
MSALVEPALAEPWSEESLRVLRGERALARRLLGALVRNPSLFAGVVLLGTFLGLGLAALVQYGTGVGTLAISYTWANSALPPGPSAAHPFGVMNVIGVDLASALYESIPWDLAIVGGILLLAAAVGTLVGSWAGYAHGALDWVVTSAVDLLLSVPPFFLVIILFVGLYNFVPVQDTLLLFVLLFAAVLWPYYARPVRARSESVTAEPYVEAARSAGASRWRTLLRHVLPNSLDPVFAQVPIDVYQVFFVLTVFPFLGCWNRTSPSHTFTWLTPLPTSTFPEWGNLLAQGVCYGLVPGSSTNLWWMYAFPALVLILFGVAVALTTDGLSAQFQSRMAR